MNTALRKQPAPYLSKVGPMCTTIANGATVTSGQGTAPHWIWARQGRITGLWLGVVFTRGDLPSNLAGVELQIWIDGVAHGTAGADAQQDPAGGPSIVDVPTPLLMQMGKGWEFMPIGEPVDPNTREWVWALTNRTGLSIVTQLWAQLEWD